MHILTHPRCTRWARPGWHEHTEPRGRSRTAAPGPAFLVWCNHCLGPPALPRMGSCLWPSAHRRTWLICAAHKTHTHHWSSSQTLKKTSSALWVCVDMNSVNHLTVNQQLVSSWVFTDQLFDLMKQKSRCCSFFKQVQVTERWRLLLEAVSD